VTAESGLAQRVAALRSRLDSHRAQLEQAGSSSGSPAFVAAMEDFLELVRTYDDADAYAALERDGSI
jgi:hypothetical protein